MKKGILTGLLVLVCGLQVGAAIGKKNGEPQPQQPTDNQGPTGYWRLDAVKCVGGNPGKLHYETAHLTLEFDNATAELTREGCEITLEGHFSIDDTVMTTEFNSGTWESCSGAMPTYVLNRFAYRTKGKRMFLRGRDLSPFASCSGSEGVLEFSLE